MNRGSEQSRLPQPPSSFPEPNVPGHGSGLGGYMSMNPYTSSQHLQIGDSRLGPPPPLPPRFFPPIQPASASVLPRAFDPIPHQTSTGYVNNRGRPLFPHAHAHACAPDSSQSPPLGRGFATPGHPGDPEPTYPPPSQSYGGSLSAHMKEYAMYTQQPGSAQYPVSPPLHFPALPITDRIGDRADPRVRQKKALLVGIDYSKHRDRKLRLNWGVYDAQEMARFLREHLGFHPNNIRILTDDQRRNLPTSANILAAMRWLVDGVQPGDSLFFYFSGHAIQIEDKDEDEPDGFISCLCAVDCDDRRDPPIGVIVDDSIQDIMIKPLPRGCRLTTVFDCCNSGTLLDLPYIYDSNGVLKPTRPDMVRRKSSEAVVISLSACMDIGRTFEARGGGSLRGAFIRHMMRWGNHGTYLELIQSLRAYMVSNGLMQRPQLSSSHWIDTDQQFVITG